MILYMDMLFIFEWMMDTGILFFTGNCIRSGKKFFQYVVGGFGLALFHILFLMILQNTRVTFLVTILTTMVVLYWLFRPKTLQRILHLLLGFLISSFILCGSVQVFISFYHKPIVIGTGIQIHAGWMPWQILVWCIVTSYVGIYLGRKWLEIHIGNRKEYAYIHLCHQKKETTLVALIDTGNTLQKDGRGVPIVELPRLFPFLEIKKIKDGLLNLEELGLEVLHYKSLGNSNGRLYGIVVDKCTIVIDANKWEFHNLYIGIGEETFAGGYEGLLPACLLEEA